MGSILCSLKLARDANQRRQEANLIPFDFGIGLNVGQVMFGNIGVASRLSFSVIGPTVNEVERIEKLTKAVNAKALTSGEIAKASPDIWTSIGQHQLEGVAGRIELFAFNEAKAPIADSDLPETGRSALMN